MRAALGGGMGVLAVACTLNVNADLNFKSENEAPPRDPAEAQEDEAGDRGDVRPGKDVGDAEEAAEVDAGDGGDNTLYVVNVSEDTVCWIYADPCGELSDVDLLGEDVLPVDWYLTVSGVADGCYDLWAFDCAGDGYWYSRARGVEDTFTWVLLPAAVVDTADTFAALDTAHTGDTAWDSAWDSAF